MATLILSGNQARGVAHTWIDAAPVNTRVVFHKPGRTIPQNARMWAMLTDVARQARHNGEQYSPEMWKSLFMHALGIEVRIIPGLDGEPFPVGFHSSKLSREQMSDLIAFMESWGAKNGVRFSDE